MRSGGYGTERMRSEGRGAPAVRDVERTAPGGDQAVAGEVRKGDSVMSAEA